MRKSNRKPGVFKGCERVIEPLGISKDAKE